MRSMQWKHAEVAMTACTKWLLLVNSKPSSLLISHMSYWKHVKPEICCVSTKPNHEWIIESSSCQSAKINQKKPLRSHQSHFCCICFSPRFLEAPGTSLGRGWRKTKTWKAVTSIYFFIVFIKWFFGMPFCIYLSSFIRQCIQYLINLFPISICRLVPAIFWSMLHTLSWRFGNHGLQFGLPSSIDYYTSGSH